MQQVIVGGMNDTLFGAATEYNCLMGGSGLWDQFENTQYQVMPTGGTISKLYVELSGNVGAGATVVFTLMVAGAPTALTCTVAAGASTASDLVNLVAVVASNTVSIRCTYTGEPGALTARWTTVFTGTTVGESICLAHTFVRPDATYYSRILGGSFADADVNTQTPMPTAGTFKKLYVQLERDPGTSPDAYSITLAVDGVASALTTTIVADNTTGNDTVNTVYVNVGQLVNVPIVPISTPSASPGIAIGMVFVSDTDGESLIIGGTYNSTTGSGTTEYNPLCSSNEIWTTIEANAYSLIQVCTIKNLYVSLGTAPGGTDTQTVSIRIGGSDSGLTVTITGAAKTGNDVVNTATPTAGQTGDIKIVPSATATATICHIGLVGYIREMSLRGIFTGKWIISKA